MFGIIPIVIDRFIISENDAVCILIDCGIYGINGGDISGLCGVWFI